MIMRHSASSLTFILVYENGYLCQMRKTKNAIGLEDELHNGYVKQTVFQIFACNVQQSPRVSTNSPTVQLYPKQLSQL